MPCAITAREELENQIDYERDSEDHIEKVADRIAKRYNLCAFWNRFEEIEFANLEEGEVAGFENA